MAMISAITHPNPPVVDGKVYDKLSVALATSTDAAGGTMALRLAVTLTPYRVEGDGVELLPDAQQAFAYADAAQAARDNPALAQFLIALAQAGQQFVNEVL